MDKVGVGELASVLVQFYYLAFCNNLEVNSWPVQKEIAVCSCWLRLPVILLTVLSLPYSKFKIFRGVLGWLF